MTQHEEDVFIMLSILAATEAGNHEQEMEFSIEWLPEHKCISITFAYENNNSGRTFMPEYIQSTNNPLGISIGEIKILIQNAIYEAVNPSHSIL